MLIGQWSNGFVTNMAKSCRWNQIPTQKSGKPKLGNSLEHTEPEITNIAKGFSAGGIVTKTLAGFAAMLKPGSSPMVKTLSCQPDTTKSEQRGVENKLAAFPALGAFNRCSSGSFQFVHQHMMLYIDFR